MKKKTVVADSAKKTKTPKTVKRAKKVKVPYRVLLGTVSKDGKKYNFESHNYTAADEAMGAAQSAIDKGNDNLRQIQILINPDAVGV